MIDLNLDALEFHLQTAKTSYIFCILPNGLPGSLYYGPRLAAAPSFRHLGAFTTSRYLGLTEAGDFPGGFLPEALRPAYEKNPAAVNLSASRVRMEYSSVGRGDYRMPSFLLRLADGTQVSRFRYRGHRVFPGLPSLPGLPRFDEGGDGNAETLELELVDSEAALELRLLYSVLPDHDGILRSASMTNRGEEPVELLSLMSLSLDLPSSDFELLQLSGSVVRERSAVRTPLRPGRQSLGSSGGTSGSFWHNPFFALLSPGASEDAGEVYAFNLVYSGNFHAGVEVDPFSVARVTAGISPELFSWRLEPSETFHAPQAVAVYSAEGLGGASRAMHDLARGHLMAPAWRGRERPVVYNSWEACYFDFDEDKLLRLAREARELGAELFVLDDGWFGKRDDDLSSLGDWSPHPGKLPRGLESLAEGIRALGLGFGLWFEPEMVSFDSDFFRAHPDCMIRTSRYAPLAGRNQQVLDFSDPEIVDLVYQAMARIIGSAKLAYLKWDMNRMMSDFGSARLPPARQGELCHRYILGVYSLYERLGAEFPGLLIESCASGGGRFDLGLLRYAPQAWTSDNTDPASRLSIQYGTSIAYPLSSMSCHLSASPNHQVGRRTSVGMRGAVAVFGAFGFELDPGRASGRESEGIAYWSAFYRAHRGLVAEGDFYRLASPFEGRRNEAAWILVSPDRGKALFAFYRLLQEADPAFRSIRLRGLDPEALYSLRFVRDESKLKEGLAPGATALAEELLFMRDRQARGDELMRAGILVDDELQFLRAGLLGESPDFQFKLCLIERLGA